MTHGILTAGNAAQPDIWESYKDTAKWGAIATAVSTLIHPLLGAGAGTYFVTSIAINIALDKLAIEQTGTLGKVIKLTLPFFVSISASIGMLSALGVNITFTPTLIGGLVALTAQNLLFGIARS